jgi:HupE/UreJ protein
MNQASATRIRIPRHTAVTLVAALILALPYGVAAHEIPNDVAVQAYVKPEGERLYLLVRVPLKAMSDIEFPERGQGYLDLARADALLPGAATLWLSDFMDVYESDARLPKPRVVETRVSLPSDKSFASYAEALAHVRGPKLADDANVYWDQVLFDVLLEYPIHSDRSPFSLHWGLARLAVRVSTSIQFVAPNGMVRAFEFLGDPSLIRLDPRWDQAIRQFVALGFAHILRTNDCLLFLFCLVIPFRRLRDLVPVAISFAVAYSITLIASAYGLAPDALWFPPLIETLIAISIVYVALENIVGGISARRRRMAAFGFGLVYGFGFAFALRQTLQFAGSHVLASLLSFNAGVELGQLVVLALLVPILELLFRFAVAERIGTIILSALVAHTGWHWMLDRSERLRQFQFRWPALNAALLASAMRWLMLILIVTAAAWFASEALRHRAERSAESKAARLRSPG